MASSRTPRSRGRSGSTRRASAPSSNNNQMVMVGVVVAIAVAVVAFFLVGNGGGGKQSDKKSAGENSVQAKDAVADKTPAEAVPAVRTSGKPGKTPDRPAPTISETLMKEAEGAYEQARQLDIQARKAQKSGNNADFNRLINDAWDKLDEAFKKLKVYDEWLDEADFEDWAIPAEYVAFQSRISKFVKLRNRIKRIRPMRRDN